MIESKTTTPPGVFQRTRKGQMAVLARRRQFNAAEARLLLLVNGFTPTSCLTDLAAMPPLEAEQVLVRLEQQGFIEKV